MRKKWLKTFASILLAGNLLSGCVTMETSDTSESNDPLEAVNRAVFTFNEALDTMILTPLAILYKDILPPPLQHGISNVLDNLRAPIIFANDLMQGKPDRAAVIANRFMVNSTVGVLGLFDVATEVGMAPHHSEDFGQTLATWGVDEGTYLVLPVFGPSNPRDAVGLVVDTLLDPFNAWARNTDRDAEMYTRAGLEATRARARYFNAIEDMKRTSLDFYAATRSAYRQRRNDAIMDGEGNNTKTSPDLSYEFNSPGPGSDDGEELSQSQ